MNGSSVLNQSTRLTSSYRQPTDTLDNDSNKNTNNNNNQKAKYSSQLIDLVARSSRHNQQFVRHQSSSPLAIDAYLIIFNCHQSSTSSSFGTPIAIPSRLILLVASCLALIPTPPCHFNSRPPIFKMMRKAKLRTSPLEPFNLLTNLAN